MHLPRPVEASAASGLAIPRTDHPPTTRVLFMSDRERRGTITRMTTAVDAHRRAALAAADYVRSLGFPPA